MLFKRELDHPMFIDNEFTRHVFTMLTLLTLGQYRDAKAGQSGAPDFREVEICFAPIGQQMGQRLQFKTDLTRLNKAMSGPTLAAATAFRPSITFRNTSLISSISPN